MALKRFEIDPGHSGIHFAVRHMMISRVRGRFTRFGGVILMDDEDPERSSAEVVIEASTHSTASHARWALALISIRSRRSP